jgi:hypothetical protein
VNVVYTTANLSNVICREDRAKAIAYGYGIAPLRYVFYCPSARDIAVKGKPLDKIVLVLISAKK